MPLSLFKIKPFTYGVGAAVLIFLSNFFLPWLSFRSTLKMRGG